MRSKPDKFPGKGSGFTWGRKTISGIVVWNLFRRDHRKKVHQCVLQLGESASTRYAADELRAELSALPSWLRRAINWINRRKR